MKKTFKLLAALLLCGSVCGGCTLYEADTLRTVSPPRNGDTIVVHPWDPNQPDIPPIGD